MQCIFESGKYIHPFTVTIDQGRKNPDEIIELIDFKSNKQTLNEAFHKNDSQLSLYEDKWF